MGPTPVLPELNLHFKKIAQVIPIHVEDSGAPERGFVVMRDPDFWFMTVRI